MPPAVAQASTTNSNQQRDDDDYPIWLRLFDPMSWLLPLTALACAIDNINLLLLATIAIWILCKRIVRAEESNRRNSKNTAAAIEIKAEQNFLSKARKLREKVYQLAVAANASKNTSAPVENNTEDEVLAKMHEVREKVYQLVVVSDARSKDTSTESALLTPSAFARVMDIILCKETHSWRKIEPELAEYLQNVTKDEDGWEWV
jgi:flagellar biosynthesis component FlhA